MIIDEILATLDFSQPVQNIRQGLFYTAAVTDHCGLAATLPADVMKQQHPSVRDPGSLQHKSTRELADMVYSESIAEAAIGMSVINSLIVPDESKYKELNAREVIIEKGRGKNIVIIGNFPFVPKLREIAGNLWVIERNPAPGTEDESETPNLVPQADVIAITGTAFTNHTIDNLLSLCRPETYVILLGGTVPLCPLLFEYGVDALSGTVVLETDLVLNCVSQGANYRQIKGVQQVTMVKA